MPFNPSVVDQSGQIRGQGITAAALTKANAQAQMGQSIGGAVQSVTSGLLAGLDKAKLAKEEASYNLATYDSLKRVSPGLFSPDDDKKFYEGNAGTQRAMLSHGGTVTQYLLRDQNAANEAARRNGSAVFDFLSRKTLAEKDAELRAFAPDPATLQAMRSNGYVYAPQSNNGGNWMPTPKERVADAPPQPVVDPTGQMLGHNITVNGKQQFVPVPKSSSAKVPIVAPDVSRDVQDLANLQAKAAKYGADAKDNILGFGISEPYSQQIKGLQAKIQSLQSTGPSSVAPVATGAGSQSSSSSQASPPLLQSNDPQAMASFDAAPVGKRIFLQSGRSYVKQPDGSWRPD